MIAPPQEILAVLHEYNPWWDDAVNLSLPDWRRVAFSEVMLWLTKPPSSRALLVSGARQVGKTTLLRQAVAELLRQGVKPTEILYATFDHPLLKLVGLEKVINIWEQMLTHGSGTEYLLLDEIQYTENWQTWIKHQVDFNKKRRIVVTGSAMPLSSASPESGVGRWHTIKLPTLSFYEYLRIKEIDIPELPDVKSLKQVASWTEGERLLAATKGERLVPHFNDYLLRGGFPETARVEDISIAQKLLREDIVDKVLKRDMTALYGVRHVLDLEKVFLYLCLHDGSILDLKAIGENLEMDRRKVNNFLGLLESAHLVYRLHPHGYGKQVLKGQDKVYLADPAISGSVLLKGRSLLQDSVRLGAAVETAFFKHVFTRFYSTSIGFYYWRQPRTQLEVDVVAEVGEEIIPFEVKYRQSVKPSDLKGIRLFCEQRQVERGYVVTKEAADFRIERYGHQADILLIPAPLACYWLSKSEAP